MPNLCRTSQSTFFRGLMSLLSLASSPIDMESLNPSPSRPSVLLVHRSPALRGISQSTFLRGQTSLLLLVSSQLMWNPSIHPFETNVLLAHRLVSTILQDSASWYIGSNIICNSPIPKLTDIVHFEFFQCLVLFTTDKRGISRSYWLISSPKLLSSFSKFECRVRTRKTGVNRGGRVQLRGASVRTHNREASNR